MAKAKVKKRTVLEEVFQGSSSTLTDIYPGNGNSSITAGSTYFILPTDTTSNTTATEATYTSNMIVMDDADFAPTIKFYSNGQHLSLTSKGNIALGTCDPDTELEVTDYIWKCKCATKAFFKFKETVTSFVKDLDWNIVDIVFDKSYTNSEDWFTAILDVNGISSVVKVKVEESDKNVDDGLVPYWVTELTTEALNDIQINTLAALWKIDRSKIL